jgi:hypothetical protein
MSESPVGKSRLREFVDLVKFKRSRRNAFAAHKAVTMTLRSMSVQIFRLSSTACSCRPGHPIYGTRNNRRYLKQQGIRFAGKPLGRPKKVTEANREELKWLKAQRRAEYLQRIPIEDKFGRGKVAGLTDDDIEAVTHYFESVQEQPGKEKINTQPGPFEGIGKPEPLNQYHTSY